MFKRIFAVLALLALAATVPAQTGFNSGPNGAQFSPGAPLVGNGSGLTNLNAPSTNFIYVSLAGSDMPGFGTNIMSPCLTLTNATNLAAVMSGLKIIQVANGTFQVPNFFTVSTNTVINGAGPTLTTIISPVGNSVFALVIGGDNAGVNNLTVTLTNLNTTNFMPLLTFTNHATNVVCNNLWLVGNSDAMDFYSPTYALTKTVTATFNNPYFYSRWDLRIMEADNAAGQASTFTFNNGIFVSEMATSQLLQGTTHDLDNKGVTVFDNNCVTIMTNKAGSQIFGNVMESVGFTNFHNNCSYTFKPTTNALICDALGDAGVNVFYNGPPDPGLCDVIPGAGTSQAVFPRAMFDVLTINSITNIGGLQSDYGSGAGSPAIHSDGTLGFLTAGKFIGNGIGLTNLSLYMSSNSLTPAAIATQLTNVGGGSAWIGTISNVLWSYKLSNSVVLSNKLF